MRHRDHDIETTPTSQPHKITLPSIAGSYDFDGVWKDRCLLEDPFPPNKASLMTH